MSETYKNIEMQVLGETGYETIYPIVTTVLEQNNNLQQKFWRGTQAEYNTLKKNNALDGNTMYIITDDSGESISGVATLGTDGLLAEAQRPKAGGLYRDDGKTTLEASLEAIDTTLANKIDASSGAGAHNAIYRGKYLGDSVTAEQYAAINDGTFSDLYIGDYWTIGGVIYRIAAFDYYYSTGDTSCDTHHITLVPDGNMYTRAMNDTDTTSGAYVSSKMYAEGLNDAKTTINSAFGEAHVLNHRQYLHNVMTGGYASAGSWYNSTVELMTEQNVYGGKVLGNQLNGTALPNSYTIDKSQYPLFAFRPDMISNRQWFWLRDVVSVYNFAYVGGNGLADSNSASAVAGVRPAFSIKA